MVFVWVMGNNVLWGGELVVMDGRWGVVVKILSNVRGVKVFFCSISVICRKSLVIVISFIILLELV